MAGYGTGQGCPARRRGRGAWTLALAAWLALALAWGAQSAWGGAMATGADATLLACGFASPSGMAFDGRGNLLVADKALGAVYSVSPGGELRLVAEDVPGACGLALDRRGNVYVASPAEAVIYRISAQCEKSVYARGVVGHGEPAHYPGDMPGMVMAADRDGNVVVADPLGRCLYRLPAAP